MTANEKDRQAFEKRHKQDYKEPNEQTSLDEFKDQQFVDDIPLEDLKIEMEQEKNKDKSQDDSQSSKKE
ncbi:MAG TPA: hypothetical protein VK135_01200 [Candidatus Dormibacteraeota bacterium]|nr:hypothetical protein [Candidatus Dormibacteraeota bacterium]